LTSRTTSKPALSFGDDARLGQARTLALTARMVLTLACDVGMFGRGIDARLVVLDPASRASRSSSA